MTTKELLALVAHLFATGYGCGHHATVEGHYTDVLPCDLDTYFEDHDAVQEAFTALCAEVEALRKDAERFGPCIWVQDLDDGSWDTACGGKHQFTEGDPCENSHAFCPYCGGHLFESETDHTDDAARSPNENEG